jgi:hypothetical protein
MTFAGAIEIIAAFAREAPSCFWIAAEHYLHGATCQPATSDKAFALRQSGYATAAYGSNYPRLVALKDKYDPTNFFCSNRDIRPQPM